MKIVIALACFIAAASAATEFKSPDPHLVKPTEFSVSLDQLPINAFWSTYIENNPDYTILQIAQLTIALFDSAAAEIDDIFSDQALKLAIYQVVQVFNFPKSSGEENAGKVLHAYSAITAWGEVEAQAAAVVEVLLKITNNAFHHFIVYDQSFEEHFETQVHIGKESAVSSTNKPVAETAIKFVLGFAHKAVNSCYNVFKDEIVEGTDGIILCKAFAYSTRGFPTEKEEMHTEKKKALFRDIIAKIAVESKNDVKEMMLEAKKGIEPFTKCISDQARALNLGFFHTINLAKAGLLKPVTTLPVNLPVGLLPFD